jgi:hypothetical protein
MQQPCSNLGIPSHHYNHLLSIILALEKQNDGKEEGASRGKQKKYTKAARATERHTDRKKQKKRERANGKPQERAGEENIGEGVI